MRVIHGDMLEALPTLEAESISAVVTDPPYHLASIVKRFGKEGSAPAQHGTDGAFARASKGFMGQTWDGGDIAFRPETWAAVLRVMKPGAHLAAFGASRNYHRMACAIEDAGFEIRDSLMWLYAAGFPKSHDISKAIDKAAGAEREILGVRAVHAGVAFTSEGPKELDITAPATPEAAQWAGWGSALKPAYEPILLCSKPLTVAQFFCIILERITEELSGCFPLHASDVAPILSGILAKCVGAGVHSVLENVKTSVLENFGNVLYVARAFTFRGRGSTEATKTRGISVPFLAKPHGNQERTQEQATHAGAAVDISTLIADTYTSVIMDGISANTALSWRTISDAILSEASTFTTETAIRLTTALATLRSCLGQSISAGIGNSSGSVKPAYEPIILARKPLAGTLASNTLAHGVGGINIDACRVEGGVAEMAGRSGASTPSKVLKGNIGIDTTWEPSQLGRWPANVLHDGSDEVMAAFEAFGEKTSGKLLPTHDAKESGNGSMSGKNYVGRVKSEFGGDTGSAARFFFCGKADADDRAGSKHPTVKPLSLITWLVRLITPPGGTVLDPFAGSGTTLLAADRLQLNAIGIEQSAEYVADIHRRLRSDAPLFADAAQ